MTCTRAHNLLDAYLDGELDLVRHLEIEHHLHDCKPCAALHESQLVLRAALRSEALYHRAPVTLPRRIGQALGREGRSSLLPIAVPWRRIGLAAAAACIALVSWGLGHFGAGAPASTKNALAEAVLASHERSLLPLESHLVDVPSSDRHEVKPWFANGRVNYSPIVPDLADSAFPLVGGRLDYLDDRPVAALVYQRRKHIINLFLWPSPEMASVVRVPTSKPGYHILHWADEGMTYWAVSDLNEKELGEFVQLVREATARR
jgi:anti-sigma factor RsiW